MKKLALMMLMKKLKRKKKPVSDGTYETYFINNVKNYTIHLHMQPEKKEKPKKKEKL